MKRVTFLSVVALAVAGIGFAQSPAMTTNDPMQWAQTISVTGNGRTQGTPDRVTFNVGAPTVSPTVDGAVNENNARVAAVVAALKKAGATDKEIRTSNFFINPQQ